MIVPWSDIAATRRHLGKPANCPSAPPLRLFRACDDVSVNARHVPVEGVAWEGRVICRCDKVQMVNEVRAPRRDKIVRYPQATYATAARLPNWARQQREPIRHARWAEMRPSLASFVSLRVALRECAAREKANRNSRYKAWKIANSTKMAALL
jgi:hypothetical protein